MKLVLNKNRRHIANRQIRCYSHGMAFNSLNDFALFLEERKELKRITYPVNPKLEITEIADRLVKKGNSPALLFENVQGSKFPVLINAFASEKRMAWALGVEKLDDLAKELAELIKTQPPQNLIEKIKWCRSWPRSPPTCRKKWGVALAKKWP